MSLSRIFMECQLSKLDNWHGQLLHALLVSLDHLLDHLAADGACLTAGQVTVVTVLQVNAHFPWCPFYIVNDSDEEVRQAVDCQEQTL